MCEDGDGVRSVTGIARGCEGVRVVMALTHNVPMRSFTKLFQFLVGIFDITLVYFNAVIDAIRTNQNTSHGGEVTSTTANVEKGHALFQFKGF